MDTNEKRIFAKQHGFEHLEKTNKDDDILKCAKGHMFKKRWRTFVKKPICPECFKENQLGTTNDIIEELKTEGPKRGYTFQKYEKGYAYFICPRGSEWKTTARDFRKHDCFCCEGSKKYIQEEAEEIIKANGHKSIGAKYINFHEKLPVMCKCGEPWEGATLFRIIEGRTCHKCAGNEKRAPEEIRKIIEGANYWQTGPYNGANQIIEVVCKDCGNKRTPRFNDLKYEHTWCKHCSEVKPEKEIAEFLKSVGMGFERWKVGQLTGKLELDFYIPSHKLAIEHCGIYYHSEVYKNTSYHKDKLEECQKCGIRLIQIFGHEWSERRSIVESKIRGMLGLNRKIYARECELKEVDKEKTKDFLDENHLQGSSPNVIKAWGLYCQSELVQVITVGNKARQNWIYNFWIDRMCTKQNTTVVGGASKLLKATSEFRPLATFADLRWSVGNVYKEMGFEFDGNTKPDYIYYHNPSKVVFNSDGSGYIILGKNDKKFSKSSLRLAAEEKENNTERELRLEQGYLRVYDCGKQRWVLK